MTPGEKDEDKMMVWTLDGDTLSPSQPGTAHITTTDDDHGVQNFKFNLVKPFN